MLGEHLALQEYPLLFAPGNRSSSVPITKSAWTMQGFKANSDNVPRRRSHAISAKAQPLRSQVAQSIVPDSRAAAQAQALAQQQMERLLARRTQQVRRNLSRYLESK